MIDQYTISTICMFKIINIQEINKKYCRELGNKVITQISQYIADNIENVIERLENYENLVFVGNGATLHRELLESRLENLEFENNNKQSAINVGKLGYKKFKEKEEILNADTITPIYLRI